MSEWIEHDGKGCPVDHGVDIVVRFRDGYECPTSNAQGFMWPHSYSENYLDIVAYRIVEPEAHMMSAPITVRPQGVQVDTVTITRDEYDALRAEVERLRTINASLATQVSSAEIEVATVYERLRKGKDDEQKCDRSHMVGEARPDFPKHPQAPSLAMVADTLDHRLGTPQPDGEPCEPMSARRWRWLP
jgi:hypothetical protein